MKKYLLLLAFVLSVAEAFSQSVLLETDFASESDFKKWTVIDANGDGATWAYDSTKTPSHVFYQYGSKPGDDWLISPAITSDKDTELLVQYAVKASDYYKETMDVYVGDGNTADAMTTRVAQHNPLSGPLTPYYFTVKARAGVPLYIGFHETSPADQFNVYLTGISVKSGVKPIDLKLDSVYSPKTGKDLSRHETVKVKVVNNGNVAVDGFRLGFSVDGKEEAVEQVSAVVQPGESYDYTFQAQADLSIPRHLYNFKAYIASEDINALNDTLTVKVRHQAPATVPYSMGFEPDEYTDSIKFYNLNNDDGKWKLYADPYYPMQRTGYYCLAYNYSKENNADDWAILEPISITEPGDYVFRFWYSGDDSHYEKLGVYWGNGDQPSDMKNKVVEYAPFARGAYEESATIIHFDKPQRVCFGFYCFSDKDENWLTIDDVKFYKVESNATDIAVTNLARPFSYVRKPNAENAVFDINNIGVSDAAVKVTLTVDNEVKKQDNINLKAQEHRTVEVPGVLNGLAAGSHTLKIALECAGDENPENDTISRTFVMLPEPVRLYDFEDGKIPSDFTFRTEDEGTINPDAGSEWNEYGWGILSVESGMYGNYTFAGNTWYDGVDKPDRWVIFPRVKVGQGDAWFVFDSSSGNARYLDDYEVKVSDGSMEPADYWYDTNLQVFKEGVYASTHGISLSKYKGEDVYVAIRLRSNGEFLCFDNIGFYGDIDFTSGIADTPLSDNPRYRIDGRVIEVPGASSVLVSDALGRTVADVSGKRVNIASLTNGVYLVKAFSAQGTVVFKFVKK